MPEREWKHKVRMMGILDGVGCSSPGEAGNSLRYALFRRGIALKTEPWGKTEKGSVILVKHVDRESLAETLVGVFNIEHPNNVITRVLLHTDSKELIRELEQKGFSFEECE